MNSENILEIRDLAISFKTTAGTVNAIRGVNLDLRRGKTLAIVGESGSGKSVTVKSIAGIIAGNGSVNAGTAMYKMRDKNGEEKEIDLLKVSKRDMRHNINGTHIAIVFQDPLASLNPTMTIGAQLILVLRSHKKVTKAEAERRAIELLREVGITEPERRMKQYPHEFSGGMRQRIVIAIALSCDPEILICDEPTTALDVTIQERVLDLIVNIQQRRGISVIYITHNLGVVAKVADYVNVMYAGRIIECGSIFDVFFDPRHPYTWGLLSAIPDMGGDTAGDLYTIAGTPPYLAKEPEGDAFAPRNPYALEIDFKAEAPMFRISDTHYAATWLLDERAPKVEMPEGLQRRVARMMKEARTDGGEL
jgi:oligopeptide transport system ATP-binding protein